jgi:hypothetical protein
MQSTAPLRAVQRSSGPGGRHGFWANLAGFTGPGEPERRFTGTLTRAAFCIEPPAASRSCWWRAGLVSPVWEALVDGTPSRLKRRPGRRREKRESPVAAGLFSVGAPRFELGTSSPPDWRANQAAPRPVFQDTVSDSARLQPGAPTRRAAGSRGGGRCCSVCAWRGPSSTRRSWPSSAGGEQASRRTVVRRCPLRGGRFSC